MYVQSKRTLRFTESEVKTSKTPDGVENRVHIERNSFIVKPSTFPTFAPDWIKADPLFELAEDDGDIYECNLSKKQQAEVDAKNANPLMAPKPAAPATGWQSTASTPNGLK